MKQKILRIVSLLIVAAFIFTVAGCNNSSTDAKTSTVNDDFFTDEETELSVDEGEAADKTQGSKKTSDSKTGSKKSSSASNTVGGKSWKDVLASMPKELKGTTVKVYNWNPASEYTGAPAVIQEFEKQTGIKVKWITQNFNTYTTKLAALVASGDSPDVVRMRTPISTRLAPMQSINACGYDFSDAAWDAQVMKDYTVNGTVYATSIKNTHIASVNMLFYNKALIQKYDLEDPYKLWKNNAWTWDKFIEMCKEYKSLSKAKVAAGGGSDWSYWSEVFGIPGPVGYDGTKYYNMARDSKFISVTQRLADLYNTDYLFDLWKADEFDNSELLFWAGASVYARRKNAYFGTLKTAGSLYTVPFPTVAGQDKYYQGLDEYESYGIPKGAKNAKAVPYFLRFFLDAANYDMNAFFCNGQTLEVYNWCMNQKNTIWTTTYNESVLGDTFGDILAKKGNQVKSFCDSNAPQIDQRCKSYNDAIAKLK